MAIQSKIAVLTEWTFLNEMLYSHSRFIFSVIWISLQVSWNLKSLMFLWHCARVSNLFNAISITSLLETIYPIFLIRNRCLQQNMELLNKFRNRVISLNWMSHWHIALLFQWFDPPPLYYWYDSPISYIFFEILFYPMILFDF